MNNIQLFLFHFAGGNIYSYNTITSLLKGIEVIPLELPGRGRRIHEFLLTDFDLAAMDLFNQITPLLKKAPFLIYGHSMGAYLGLRVASMLEQVGTPPSYLIVSGNPGPGISHRESGKRSLLEKDEFIAELRDLGGIPEEIFQNQDLFNFFEPILRADFQIVESQRLEHEPPISAPIFTLMGSDEQNVNQLLNWRRFTSSDFHFKIMEGNHFFIHKHPNRIARILKKCCERVTIAIK